MADHSLHSISYPYIFNLKNIVLSDVQTVRFFFHWKFCKKYTTVRSVLE